VDQVDSACSCVVRRPVGAGRVAVGGQSARDAGRRKPGMGFQARVGGKRKGTWPSVLEPQGLLLQGSSEEPERAASVLDLWVPVAEGALMDQKRAGWVGGPVYGSVRGVARAPAWQVPAPGCARRSLRAWGVLGGAFGGSAGRERGL